MTHTVAYHVPFIHKITFSYCIDMHSSQWSKGIKKSFRFGVPMLWRETKKITLMIAIYAVTMLRVTAATPSY
jgi:hypothetical protein